MDYSWIFKQVAFTCFGTILGYVIGKYAKKTLNDEGEPKQDDGENDCHIALIINSSLKMGKGKVAAQCGHSVVSLMKQARKSNEVLYEKCVSGACQLQLFSVESSDDFNRLRQMATGCSLPSYVVADAGRTQIASGSLTVLGVGPASAESINHFVTGLKPYK
ncbi:peptidyl-tRNA hydrolase 2, mitochondrial [Nilaparvata lugens]|uniref:peptidyl-tRNA hydrolase 2, mitochondrial n=1 Tax=Nilaparvata lugens TaxID=108931 RepID=UPI00193CC3FB|nr:peptidyl-tRNA hydrolase 2, mitochondrial [Nilaparvata lugens]XP_039286757.1 peptidyl-tRNA hydrolase 2, mitochondrial [Nilaparvata lugens]